jgi:hypothetical protein
MNEKTEENHGKSQQEQAIFLCGLFNDAVSSSDYIASNGKMINE